MRTKNIWKTAFFALAAVVIVFGAGLYVGISGSDSGADAQRQTQVANNPGDTRVPTATPVPDNAEGGFSEVAQSVLPVVVEVSTVQVIEQEQQHPFFEFFGEPDNDQEFERPGLGSGVIVDQEGSTVYIITNNHVIGDADDITVSTYEGAQYDADVVGSDPLQDLALISIETDQNMPVASLGDSEGLSVGEWVLAIGNPLGFESTVTAGIISAVGRQPGPGTPVAEYTDYIQTDAAINQGNSGGALVNMDGEIIGINTWIAAGGPTGGNVGLGFAIPVNNVAVAIDQFREDGEITYGWLGVSITDVDDLDETLTDDLGITGEDGSFIIGAYTDSPAARDGIRPGDLVTSVDGEPIENSLELQRAVGHLMPGQQVDFDVIRDGESMTIPVTIDERGPEEEVGQPDDLWPGFQVAPLTDEIRESQGIPGSLDGAIIANVAPESPAAEAGLRPGDLILEVDGNELDGAGDFYTHAAESSGEIMLRIVRGGTELTIGMEAL